MSLNFKFNKKGNVPDIFLIVVVLFGVAVSILFGFKLMGDLQDKFDNQLNSQLAKDFISDAETDYNNIFDNIFMFLFIGSIVAVMVSAFFVRSHPIFFGISTFILVFILIFSALIANTWDELATKPQLAAGASNFTMMAFIMNNLGLVVTLIGVIVLIVLYGKRGEI